LIAAPFVHSASQRALELLGRGETGSRIIPPLIGLSGLVLLLPACAGAQRAAVSRAFRLMRNAPPAHVLDATKWMPRSSLRTAA